ncbi:hypothetical protein ABT56_05785 [Photobacterium aquae]|uniref:LPP20 lipoprotein n=1 Tax=Photobacterium aquae TaxID=1195763 RepID=A0A0J1H5P8_9GAMM|nr:LPP20 family lipoprotein [Photobacterium aquae]KLV07070.1 hypothetical protein ABT56_05785 [Photobacterium aquae]
MKKVVMFSVAAALMGCQSTPEQPAPQVVNPVVHECYFFGAPEKPAPNWICSGEVNRDGYARSAVGFSGNSAGGLAHQKNLAIQQGQKELADQVKSEIIVSMKNKTGTLGVNGQAGATQATSAELDSVSNVVLEGVETIRTMRGPDGYFYVHLALPKQALQQNVERVVDEYQDKHPEEKQGMTPEENLKLADDIAKALAHQ